MPRPSNGRIEVGYVDEVNKNSTMKTVIFGGNDFSRALEMGDFLHWDHCYTVPYVRDQPRFLGPSHEQ